MKRKLICTALVVMMLLMQVMTVFAEGPQSDFTVTATDATGNADGTVTITIAFSGLANTANSVGLTFAYDETKLSFDSANWLLTKAETETGSSTTEAKEAMFFRTQHANMNTDVYELVLHIADDCAVGDYNVTVDAVVGKGSQKYIGSTAAATIHVVDGANVSGTVACNGDASVAATVELVQGDTVIDTTTAKNGETYLFQGVQAGTYTIRVSKTKHCTREYAITVAEDTVQNVELSLYGDLNSDAEIDVMDVMEIINYINYANSVFDNGTQEEIAYIMACADLNADDEIDVMDVMEIINYINYANSVFDTMP